MTRETTFIVPGQPQGKARAKVSTINGFARAYTPEKTAAYENLVKLSFKGVKALGAVKIKLQAFYQIPKSKPKKWQVKALSGDIRPLVKPDIDNVIKIICDALNGIAYHDDTQVIEVLASKFYALDPCVKVTIIEEIKV